MNKTPYFGSSEFFIDINVDMTEKLVTSVIGSMPVVICNHFHERLANKGKITTFMGVTSKSTFSAENFIHSFSMSISIDFDAIRS